MPSISLASYKGTVIASSFVSEYLKFKNVFGTKDYLEDIFTLINITTWNKAGKFHKKSTHYFYPKYKVFHTLAANLRNNLTNNLTNNFILTTSD